MAQPMFNGIPVEEKMGGAFGGIPVDDKQPQEPPKRGFTDVIKDVGVSFAGGANALLETGGNLAGLAGVADMDNWASRQGKSGREYWESGKSDALKADEAARRAAIDSADGEWAKAGTAFWETVKNPALLSSFAAEQIPMFLPIGMAGRAGQVASLATGVAGKTAGAAGKLAGKIGAEGITARLAQKGLTGLATAEGAAGTIGTGVGIGAGAALQGADVGGDAYEELLKLPDNLWAQNKDYQQLRAELGDDKAAKEAVALSLARQASAEGGVASVLTNLLPFARTFERATAGAPTKLKGNIAARGIKGFAGEAMQEASEEGLGRVSVNRAVGDIDPTREWSQGVGEAAGMGAVGGGVMGGVMGMASNPAPPGSLTSAANIAAQQGVTPTPVPTEAIDAAELLGTPDDTAPPLAEAAQAPLAEPASMSILDGVTNGATSRPTSTTPDTGSATGASDNTAGSDTNGVFQHDAATGAGRLRMPGTAVEDDGAGGVQSNGSNQPRHVGHPSEVVLPDNSALPAQWEVVDADQVTATLKEGKNQPRDRSRAAANAQVQGIANMPDYRRLADSPVMDVGAPTLSQDGAIVGGNGRFEGVSRAYDQGTAAEYRARLEADAAAKGIDPATFSGMGKPVLVRRITQPFDTRALAVASNSGGSLQYSALEQAKIDGERMNSLGDIEVNDTGDVVMSGDNMANVRRALTGYNAAEMGSMTDKDGLLSQEGIRRIKNALLYKAYGNSSVLSRLIESADPDLKSVMGALVRFAGSVASVRADMKDGNKPADADIAEDLLSGVELLSKIKAQGSSVEQYLAQDVMFGKEYTKEAAAITHYLSDNIRSQKRMAEYIKSYYDGIANEDHLTGSMFETAPASKKERLDHAARQAAAGSATEQRPTERGRETTTPVVHAQDQHQSENAQRATVRDGAVQQDTGVTGDGTKAAPITVEHHDHVKLAEQNVNTNPTDAQKEAGNYQKAHVQWNGLDITIENPQGSERSGTDANGKAWSVTMPATYGYIKRTEGADGEHIDVYLGKHLQNQTVYVIDQIDLKTGKFDEHKNMLGFATLREAERIYKLGFSDGKGKHRLGATTPMALEKFKEWIKTEDTTKPVAESLLTSYTQSDIAKREQVAQGTTAEDQAAVDRAVEHSRNQPLSLSTQTQERSEGKTSQAGMFTPDGRASVAAEQSAKAGNVKPATESKPEEIVVKQPYNVNTMAGIPEFTQAEESAANAPKNTIVRVRIEKDGLYEHDPVKTLYGAFVANGDGTATWAQERFPASKENPPEYTQSDIDAEMSRRQNAERNSHLDVQRDYARPDVQFDGKVEAAKYWDEKSEASKAKSVGGWATVHSSLDREMLTNGEKFIMVPNGVMKNGAMVEALAAEGWKPAQSPKAEQPASTEGEREEIAQSAIEQADAIEPAESSADVVPVTPVNEIQGRGQEAKIGDFGRKVTVRKDEAKATGPRMAKEADDRPAWARPYMAMQVKTGDAVSAYAIERDKPNLDKWQVMKKSAQMKGAVAPASRQFYATEQEALDSIPLIEVARNHKVYSYDATGTQDAALKNVTDKTKQWGIYRILAEGKKRALVKGGFATYEEAMQHIAAHPVEIIEHKFEFPERPWLDKIERTGADRRNGKPVTKQMFIDTFAPGGVVYGNWLLNEDGTVNDDGQELSNHAYDGLMDLADTLGIPPKALFLNGDMVLGLGADGKGGKNSAAAHYSPDKGLINLTKINGAGSLAHEWWHSVDHYFAKNSGYSGSSMVANNGWFSEKSATRPELAAAVKHVVKTINYAEKSKTTDADLVRQGAQKRLDDAVKSLDYKLNDLRSTLEKPWKEGKKPATAEQLKQWDALADKLRAGEQGEQVYIPNPSKMRGVVGFSIGTHIRDMNAIYKAVGGNSFLRQDPASTGRQLVWPVEAIKENKIKVNAKDDVTVTYQGRTDFFLEAREIDGYRASNYWSTPEEMGARAFESYIFDKLTAGKQQSDYLVYGVENRYYAALGMKPYPEGSERQAINASFDNLFQTIQTKETDKGTAIYSAAEGGALPESDQLSAAAIAQVVEERLAQFAHQPKVFIRDTERDVLGDAARNDGIATSGMVYKGDIHLFRDGLTDTAAVSRTIWHELLHYGLRRFLTKEQYIAKLNPLYMQDGWIRKQANAWLTTDQGKAIAAKDGNAYARARGVDEALAELAEADMGEYQNNGMVAKALRTVARWVAKLADTFGFKDAAARWNGVTNDEARDLVRQMFRKLKNDEPATSSDWAFMSDPAFMVAWHGSPHDHDKFDSSKIGTGEGVQVYGYGLYFAGAREVAEYYRDALAKRGISIPDNISDETIADMTRSVKLLQNEFRQEAKDAIARFDIAAHPYNVVSDVDKFGSSEVADFLLKHIVPNANKGRLYQVELAPSENEFLLWDKPLSEQSEKVKAALAKSTIGFPDKTWNTGEKIYESFGGKSNYKNTNERAKHSSEELHKLGIRGIKYLDGSSRSKGDGNYNYVIFNDEDVSITAKFSKAQVSDALKPNRSEADAFRASLDAAMSSLKSVVSPITVGSTPAVLQELGASNLPIQVSRDVVRKATNGVRHNVSMDAIRALPEEIANPVMVFKSASEENALVVLTEMTDENGAPIIAAVHLSAKEGRQTVNRIGSIYGKDEIGAIEMWIKQGNLLYRNQEKSLDWVRRSGLQLSKGGSLSQGSLATVKTEQDIVNGLRSSSGMRNPTPQTVESIKQATAKLRASWHDFKRVIIVQSVKEIPNELYLRALRAAKPIDQHSEGIYDPKTYTVYLIADNIASPERAVWVAIHEVVGHGGIRMLGSPVVDALIHAAKNGFVTKLAQAIATDRGEIFDARTHTDEAIAELAAATITGNVDAILERYGVKVPIGMRSNLLGMIRRVVDAVRQFIGRVTGKPVTEVSDGEVLGLIRQMKDAVEGKAQEYDTAGVSQGALASKSGKQAAQRAQAFAGDVLADFRNDMPLKRHADYKAAKGGDIAAAVRLVSDLVKPESIAAAKAKFGDDVAYLPVMALEASGKNQIPNALAIHYAAKAGGTLATSVFQTNKAYHTGADAMERMIARSEFDGEVIAGQKYVLVDDVTTMGGTLADMASYIRSRGGVVSGAVLLTNASRSGSITTDAKVIRSLEERHGQAIRELFGIEPGALTRDEAQYLIGFRSTDELRTRAATASAERGRRIRSKDVSEPQDSATLDRSEPLASRPAQPKTRIVGDAGRQYTAEQRAAMARTGSVVTQKSTKETLQTLWQGAGKKLAQGMVDQFRPIRDLDEHAYTLMRLSKGATGAFEAFMHHGKLSIKDGAFDADTKGGVLEKVFYPLGKESTDYLRWVAGNRAERLVGEGKENLFTPEDIAAFKSLADGKTDFDYTMLDGTVTRDRALIYRDSLKKFNEFNKNVLDIAEQSGLIDGASRKLWEHEFYVPFYRTAAEEDGGVRGMNIKSGVIRQQAFQKLKGGEQQLNDLLENTLMNWAHLIDASAKNRAAMATLKAAEKVGAARKALPGEKKTVWFMENGQKAEYKVEDPYLMEAISSLEYAGLRGGAMDAMSKMKHWLTIGVTASPFFKVRNLIRDSVQAIGTASNSDLSYNPLANVTKGFKLTDRKNAAQEYVSALAGGGLIRFGTMLEGSEAKRTRQLIKQGSKDSHILDNENKVRALYDKYIEPSLAVYNELGNRGEEINRMALYDTLIKQGMDHATASLMARDLMDFSMQGTWTSVRFLTQIVPFMNARLQGLYKLGRATQDDKARFAIVLGATAMASLALLAAYGDDDDWKQREDWDRDNYWWFKIGGEAFRIPKPFEIGAIATLAERSAELVFDKEMTGGRFVSLSLGLAGNQLAMNPTPQLFKPVIDLYANKDSFTGRDIESMGMERLAPDYRFKQSTSLVARGISTAGNTVTGGHFLSPVQIDHVARAYFGWLGSFAVGAADETIRYVSDNDKRPSRDMWKFATGGMVSSLDGAQSRYVSQMYQQARELEEAYGTWRRLQKEGKTEEAKEYREDNKDKLAKYRRVENIKKQASKINERIRDIERGNLDSDEKRRRINNLRKQQDVIARRLVSP